MPQSHPQFFTFEQAAKLAGIPYRTLISWKNTRLYVPELADHQLCSFRDVVALRTLRVLSAEHHIPVGGKRGLRAFGRYLARHREHPWSDLRFYIAGRELLFRDPTSGKLISHAPAGQVAEAELFDIEAVVLSTRRDARSVFARSTDARGRIGQRKGLVGGKPVVQGTRIPTATLFAFYKDGFSIPEILRQYPSLSRDDVEAAIAFEKKRSKASA